MSVQQSASLCSSLKHLLQLRHFAKIPLNPKLFKPSNLTGSQRLRKRGQGMEFYQARPYVDGDDVRSIDWRITARKGKTHTREFQQDHESPQFIIVDINPHMRFASVGKLKSVQAAEFSAWFGWRSLHNHNRIGAIINQDSPQFIRPTLNPKRFSYWLNHLSQATIKLLNSQQPAQQFWHASIRTAIRLTSPGGRIQLIGDLLTIDDEAWSLLKHVAQQYTIDGVHIEDPLERKLPRQHNLIVSDGQTKIELGQLKQSQYITEQKRQLLWENFRFINGNLQEISTSDKLF